MVIALSGKKNVEKTPMAIALYITAAYWCTSSTSFANPAVTIARSFTDTFSGIQGNAVFMFICAQIVGAFLTFGFSKYLSRTN
jgi:glycerol uptake facilitator-like aquaporin